MTSEVQKNGQNISIKANQPRAIDSSNQSILFENILLNFNLTFKNVTRDMLQGCPLFNIWLKAWLNLNWQGGRESHYLSPTNIPIVLYILTCHSIPIGGVWDINVSLAITSIPLQNIIHKRTDPAWAQVWIQMYHYSTCTNAQILLIWPHSFQFGIVKDRQSIST